MRLGLNELGYASVVQQALRMTDPSRYWEDIMQVLPNVPRTSIGKQLQSQTWLPTKHGTPVAPEFVLRIEGSEDPLSVALEETASNYVSFSELARDLQAHPNAQDLVTKVLADREQAIITLGQQLSDLPTYYVGELMTPEVPPTSKSWVEALGNAYDFHPALRLLKSLGPESESIWESLTKPISLPRILDFLSRLRRNHKNETSPHVRETILDVHDAYLYIAVTDPEWNLREESLELLNKAGQWRPPSQLCYAQESVDRDYVLDDRQARVIGAERVKSDAIEGPKRVNANSPLPKRSDEWQDIETRLEDTGKTLKTYFAEWRGHTKDELIGGFLALLGDDERVRRLASHYLGNWPLETFRSSFTFLRPDNKTFPEILSLYRFVVKVEPGDEFQVENLLGDPMIVTATSNPDTMFAGRVDHEEHNGIYYSGVRLLKLDPHASSQNMRRLLLNSASHLLMRSLGYLRKNLVQLETAWDELENSEQLDLAVTRQLLLESSFQYIKSQLGVRSEHLNQLFKRWDDARYALGASRQLANPERGEIERSESAIKAVQGELAELLESDQRVQQDVLEGVKKKLRDYQYSIDAIPFELFQNADDALVELDNLEEELSSTTFKVISREQTLNVMHWGRPINYGGRNKEYHRDLEKMLTINASSKDEGVTGKFGLGFKSVFLLTDQPIVVSHDLAFEVKGGILPKKLEGKPFEVLREQLETHGNRSGTIIHLPCDAAPAEDVLERFMRLAPIMLLFAKRIDRCDLIVDSSPVTFQWQASATAIQGVRQFQSEDARILQITASVGTVALQLTSNGIEAFPEDIPNLWVTAPTREAAGLGVLINAQFDLDVGRAQVARESTKNLQIARTLGTELRGVLAELAEQPFPALATEMKLHAVDKTAFWTSVFEAFKHGFHLQNLRHGMVEIAWEVLWGEEGAYRSIIATHDVLPTLIPGEHAALTNLKRATHYLHGIIAEPEVLEHVFQWRLLAREFNTGELVHKRIWSSLQQTRVPHNLLPLTLPGLLERALQPVSGVAADLADELGTLITSEWLAQQESEARDEIRKVLRTARFMARDGKLYPPGELLHYEPDDEDSEESLRAAIAPREHLLEPSYNSPRQIAFFKACRGPMQANSDTLREWILGAENELQRQHALHYLLHGELSRPPFHRRLRAYVNGSWLEHPMRVSGFEGSEYGDLKAILGLVPELLELIGNTEESPPPELLSDDPRELLEFVHEQWTEERPELLAEHERITYPFQLELCSKYDPASLLQRRSWLTLLLSGSMLSLGRVRPEQNRGFLELCIERGWMEKISDPELERVTWLDIIDDYFDAAIERDSEEYHYWMRLFLSIYQLSNWLDEYVQFLLWLENTEDPVIIEGIWSPMTLSQLSGSGITAPPLKRTLNLGKHFVLRELRRREVLTNTALDPYCYTPSTRVRDAFHQLGCQLPAEHMQASKEIHSFLERHIGKTRATFHGSFDLPFWFSLHEVEA